MARAVRITENITVDGRLDEAVWMLAPLVTEFWQMTPDEGAPASRPTELRFLYDDQAISLHRPTRSRTKEQKTT